jgi:uncharacterized protein (TIGR04255 family)
MEHVSKSFPNYENPPVIEVVCGILFKNIKSLLAAHIGLLWEKYKKEYPSCSEVPPLAPAIERFDTPESPLKEFELAEVPPLPRIWFIHEKENGIVQVQRDRFLHNWKKIRPEDEYPRYPVVIKLFKDRLSQFLLFLQENQLGTIIPLQYEMTYINHIPLGDGWEDLKSVGKVFPDFAFRNLKGRFLSEPESINWRTSFILPNDAGRLHVKIRNGLLRESQVPVLLLDLTVRGIGEFNSLEKMYAWFDIAREWIVRGFKDLTGEEVQKRIWKAMD